MYILLLILITNTGASITEAGQFTKEQCIAYGEGYKDQMTGTYGLKYTYRCIGEKK